MTQNRLPAEPRNGHHLQSEVWMRLSTRNGMPPGKGTVQNRRFNDRHVMLVQNGAIELRAVTEMISVLGYRVTPIEESGDALSCVNREPCDVVIIEQNLRQINGYQLARRIRRYSPRTRILLMTACCQAEVADCMNDRVVDGWLFKPFGIEALNDMLENVQDSGQEAEWTI
jgi:two-component system cell cycle sensor histidine kinase/response regulator CckA